MFYDLSCPVSAGVPEQVTLLSKERDGFVEQVRQLEAQITELKSSAGKVCGGQSHDTLLEGVAVQSGDFTQLLPRLPLRSFLFRALFFFIALVGFNKAVLGF